MCLCRRPVAARPAACRCMHSSSSQSAPQGGCAVLPAGGGQHAGTYLAAGILMPDGLQDASSSCAAAATSGSHGCALSGASQQHVAGGLQSDPQPADGGAFDSAAAACVPVRRHPLPGHQAGELQTENLALTCVHCALCCRSDVQVGSSWQTVSRALLQVLFMHGHAVGSRTKQVLC